MIICKNLSKNALVVATVYSFLPYVSYSPSVTLGKDCIICVSSVITDDIRLGDFVIINLDCTIEHDAVLNNYVTLYPSVNFSGCVSVGKLSEIGTGTNIIQGKSIGYNTIVGAGSVAIHDIPENYTAVGFRLSQ